MKGILGHPCRSATGCHEPYFGMNGLMEYHAGTFSHDALSEAANWLEFNTKGGNLPGSGAHLFRSLRPFL
jgi:hypothetical protein